MDIESGDELRALYQRSLFDYERLVTVLKKQAQLFGSVVGKERFYPSHFRVGFYGRGFDSEIANQEFIYRGNRLEAVLEFSIRIRQKFPDAGVISPGYARRAPEHGSLPQLRSGALHALRGSRGARNITWLGIEAPGTTPSRRREASRCQNMRRI